MHGYHEFQVHLESCLQILILPKYTLKCPLYAILADSELSVGSESLILHVVEATQALEISAYYFFLSESTGFRQLPSCFQYVINGIEESLSGWLFEGSFFLQEDTGVEVAIVGATFHVGEGSEDSLTEYFVFSACCI